jgi:hypothetical protein
MRAPLGREWNAAAVARELVRPDVTTRAGAIIAPIAFAKVQRGAGEAVARAASAIASKGQSKRKAR